LAVILKRPRALDDLAEIWAYIATDSIDNADNFVALIDSKLRALARQPRIGRSRPEVGKGFHSFAVGRYVIFYLPLSNGIEIIRVLHGARDIDSVLQDD
jgi:toxin ParE1/3/4